MKQLHALLKIVHKHILQKHQASFIEAEIQHYIFLYNLSL